MTTNPFTITTKAVKVLESSQTLEQHMTARQYTRLAFRALRQSLDATANRRNNHNDGLWYLLADELRQASKAAHKKFLPSEEYELSLYPGEKKIRTKPSNVNKYIYGPKMSEGVIILLITAIFSVGLWSTL